MRRRPPLLTFLAVLAIALLAALLVQILPVTSCSEHVPFFLKDTAAECRP